MDILDYKYLVVCYASKFKNYCDIEDLIQVGMIGLIKAWDKFDFNSNNKFSTYAYLWIKGEILNYISNDRNIRVSKDYLRINESIEKAKCVMRQKLLREPSLDEVALFLDIDIDLVNDVVQSCSFVKSMDYIIDNDDGYNLYDSTSYEDLGLDSEYIDLKLAIDKLSEEEKRLIIYRYYDNMTQNETSKLLGINQVKVSRNETKILQKLKTQLM